MGFFNPPTISLKPSKLPTSNTSAPTSWWSHRCKEQDVDDAAEGMRHILFVLRSPVANATSYQEILLSSSLLLLLLLLLDEVGDVVPECLEMVPFSGWSTLFGGHKRPDSTIENSLEMILGKCTGSALLLVGPLWLEWIMEASLTTLPVHGRFTFYMVVSPMFFSRHSSFWPTRAKQPTSACINKTSPK